MYEKKYMYLRSIKESNFGSKRIFDHREMFVKRANIYIYWIRGISFGNENIDRALFTSNRNSMKKRAILLYTSIMQSRSTRIAYKTDEFSIFFQRPSLESTAWEFTISKYPNNRCGRQIETKNFSGIETKTNNTRSDRTKTNRYISFEHGVGN